jgi:hypothetical protein
MRRGLGLSASRVLLCLLAAVLTGCAYLYKVAVVAYVEVDSHLPGQDLEIEVYRTFVVRYRDRVTIDTRFRVDKAWQHPNPPYLDGDFHFSGRTWQVGLPTVGEIVNAADQQPAIKLLQRAHKTGRKLRISGVWRLWPEHAGNTEEEQGKKLPELKSANPSHVFEMHPVTRIDGISLLNSFHPVKGFKPGDADTVFKSYQAVPCKLAVKPWTVSILTRKGLYNCVEFIMEVDEDHPQIVRDGRFVMASVRDLKGKLLVKRIRMVFMKDTAPEAAVKGLRRGDRLKVYGIPRISFAEISRRIAEYRRNPRLLSENLPYEIIVIGVL